MSYFIALVLGVLLTLTLGLSLGVNFLHVTEGAIFRYVFYALILLVIVDAIGAIIPRVLPKKWFSPFNKFYKVFAWERKFYTMLGIKKWKSNIPETGGQLAGFAKSNLLDASDNEYIFRFMEETVKGEVGHFIGFIFSFVIVFINPKIFIVAGIPLMLLNMVLNILPVMIQRYNRPKLMALYKRNERRQKNNLTN